MTYVVMPFEYLKAERKVEILKATVGLRAVYKAEVDWPDIALR
jgi:hypothetical protein